VLRTYQLKCFCREAASCLLESELFMIRNQAGKGAALRGK
jgi:hypothetical protein